MNKTLNLLFASAAVAVLAISCAKETPQPQESATPDSPAKGIVFSAGTETVKTTISDGEGDTKVVSWALGDAISVFYTDRDGNDQSDTPTAASAGTSTTFDADVTSADDYYAVYPATAGSYDAGTLSVIVPASQDGTFASANIAAATTTLSEKNFSFKNATTLVKFSVSGAGYTKAVFNGTLGEPVAGTAAVTSFDSEGVIVLGEVSDPSAKVEVALSGAGTYYFSVLPGSFPSGYGLTLYKGETADEPAIITSSKVLAPSTMIDMGAVDQVAGVNEFFVTPAGAGKKTGKSWNNAMGVSELKAFIEQPVDGSGNQIDDAAYYKASILDGATIYMAAGDYFLAGAADASVTMAFEGLSNPVELTFMGGYPANLTGANVSVARDTSLTAFTGQGTGVTAKIFTIKDNVSVTFDGITFKNSVTSDSEHAALGINAATASVTVNHCTFKDNSNSNTGQSGAAITLVSGSLNLSNSSFSGNSARNAGALFLKDAGQLPVRVSDCTFSNNTSANTSGAVQNAKWTDVKFSRCAFTGNTAQDFGGGAFHTSTGAVTTFEDCIFSGNSASATGTSNGRGGAISLENSASVTCTRCSFVNNTANCGDKSLSGETKSAVESNVGGGAIILRHAGGRLTLNDCSFTGNTAPNGCGGAIGVQKAGALVSITGGTVFTDNSCYFQGGAVFSIGDLAIEGSSSSRVRFSNNKTLHTTRNCAQGGAVWVGRDGSATIRYALFSGNEAGVEAADGYSAGGALRASTAKTVAVSDCEFTDNRGSNGNAFSYSLCEETCSFVDCNFHDNIGRSGVHKDGNASRFYGGVGEVTASTLTFSGCTFKDNLAMTNSGVIHFNNSNNLTPDMSFADCVFDGNQALSMATAGSSSTSNNGGGCFKCTAGMKMTFNRCIFKNNRAHNRGAVFQLDSDDLVFMNQVAFYNNSLTGTGNIWGVNIHSGKSVVCMNNVTSVGNSAPNAGNHYAFNTDGGWIIANSTLIDNCTTGVVRANNSSGNGSRKSVFCNDVIINVAAVNAPLTISTALTSAGHNLLSCSSAPANLTLDSSDMMGITALPSGAYAESDGLGYYSWTNNLTGFTPATASVVEAAIKSDSESVGSLTSNVGTDFYNWLDSLSPKGYLVDGRGITRSGSWWPGAYQAN